MKRTILATRDEAIGCFVDALSLKPAEAAYFRLRDVKFLSEDTVHVLQDRPHTESLAPLVDEVIVDSQFAVALKAYLDVRPDCTSEHLFLAAINTKPSARTMQDIYKKYKAEEKAVHETVLQLPDDECIVPPMPLKPCLNSTLQAPERLQLEHSTVPIIPQSLLVLDWLRLTSPQLVA